LQWRVYTVYYKMCWTFRSSETSSSIHADVDADDTDLYRDQEQLHLV